MMVRGGAMSYSSPHKAPHELRTLVKDYLVTEDFPDGWVEPEEISDQAAPDLILARELWSLIEQLETAHQALLEIQRTSTTGAAGNSTEYGQWVDEIVQAVLAANPRPT
jgi:hypothetical protein